MFTGLIEEIGEIREVKRSRDGVKVLVGAEKVLDELKVGDSVNVNGACLTVTEVEEKGFRVDVVRQTMSETTFSGVRRGEKVNLERALRVSDRMGGHLVSGHVDAVGKIAGKSPGKIVLEVPSEIRRYIYPKASIAVDGISLTVQNTYGNRLEVAIIPHTDLVTTLGIKKVGHKVNIEVDIIAKQVETLMRAKGS